MSPASVPPVPFGRYVLRERIAAGGMGEVFRAVAVGDHGFEKPVVVKRLLPIHASRSDFAALFVAEARLMTRLAHPNIVEVLDFGRGETGDYYLVLELVEGADLGRMMRATRARAEPFPVPLALSIASQVLRGLHHAHTRLAAEGAVLVHRDVSPSNVLCSTEGEVKVADFGVALVRQIGESTTAAVMGKPGYMAPEQLAGAPLDARADVFAVGVLLHQMLADAMPFADDATGDRAPLPALREDVPAAIDAIVARALARDREDRWPDARAMAHALEQLSNDGQRLANGDDVAEAVARAERDAPMKAKLVIGLSGSDVGPERLTDSLQELTRTSVIDGLGAFAIRPLEPSTARISSPDPEASEKPEPPPLAPPLSPPGTDHEPTSGRPRRAIRAPVLVGLGVAVAVAGVGGFVAFGYAHTPPPVLAPQAPAIASDGGAAVAIVPVAPAPPPSATTVEAPPAPTASASASSRSPRAPARGVPAPSAAAAPSTSAVTAAIVPSCVGEVAFASEGSWTVTGGPGSVQTPAIVSWPCGTYNVSARSRLDPSEEKFATVTVGAERRATVDLRR